MDSELRALVWLDLGEIGAQVAGVVSLRWIPSSRGLCGFALVDCELLSLVWVRFSRCRAPGFVWRHVGGFRAQEAGVVSPQ